MNARDIIDELSLINNDINSYLEIMESLIVELDQKTTNSRDRNKILKVIDKFYVVWKGLISANKTLDKGLNNALWNVVLTLEEQIPNKK